MLLCVGGVQVLLLLAVDVLEHCVASVRQLKGITATYRMTAKGPPVRHSHYVAGEGPDLGLHPHLCAALRLLTIRQA